MLFTYSSSSSSSVTGSSRTMTQPCSGTLRHIDALLDDALRLSLPGLHEIDAFRDRLPVYLKSAGTPPSAAPLEQIAATARARLCQSLQGRIIHLVGLHETLYQLHTYLLKTLHPPPCVSRVPVLSLVRSTLPVTHSLSPRGFCAWATHPGRRGVDKHPPVTLRTF